MNKNSKACMGCLLRLFVIILASFIIVFLVVSIYNHKQKKYPHFAKKEVVESFAGITFPNYSVVNTSKYIDHTTLMFDSIPDRHFYEELDSLTTISYICKNKNKEIFDTINIWFYDDSLKTFHLKVDSDLAYYYESDPLVNSLVRQGVSQDFFNNKEFLYYGIHIPINSLEWEIDYWGQY